MTTLITASTRLNSTIRATAQRKLMEHTFKARVDQMTQARAHLAMLIYYDRFNPDERRLIEVMPNDWCQHPRGLTFTCGERRDYFEFSGHINYQNTGGGLLRLQAKVDRHQSVKVPGAFSDPIVSASSELGGWIKEHQDHEKQLEEDYTSAVKAAEVALRSYNTIGRLKDAWPEIAPFLPTEEPTLQVAALPALQVADLNSMFGLPVETAA